jgi:hypothetical protein
MTLSSLQLETSRDGAVQVVASGMVGHPAASAGGTRRTLIAQSSQTFIGYQSCYDYGNNARYSNSSYECDESRNKYDNDSNPYSVDSDVDDIEPSRPVPLLQSVAPLPQKTKVVEVWRAPAPMSFTSRDTLQYETWLNHFVDQHLSKFYSKKNPVVEDIARKAAVAAHAQLGISTELLPDVARLSLYDFIFLCGMLTH